MFTASELQSMQVECNGLQKECSVLRSEKQDIVNKQQKEKSSLQSECASLRAENEELLKTHQKEKSNLQSECAALRTEKEAELQKRQQLEKDLARSVYWSTLLGALYPHLCAPSVSSVLISTHVFWFTWYHIIFCSHLLHIELSFVLLLVVCVPRTLSWKIAVDPLSRPSRRWRRGWWPCSSSTSRIAPHCKLNWMRQTAAARLCKKRYAPQKLRHQP